MTYSPFHLQDPESDHKDHRHLSRGGPRLRALPPGSPERNPGCEQEWDRGEVVLGTEGATRVSVRMGDERIEQVILTGKGRGSSKGVRRTLESETVRPENYTFLPKPLNLSERGESCFGPKVLVIDRFLTS